MITTAPVAQWVTHQARNLPMDLADHASTQGQGYLRRFTGTIRREYLDRILLLGRRHPDAVHAEYVERLQRPSVPTVPWTTAHRPRLTRLLRSSVRLIPPGCEQPTVGVA